MCAITAAAAAAVAASPNALPDAWTRRWASPPLADRPLQIIHGIEPRARSGMAQMVPGSEPDEQVVRSMASYRDLGLGGVVCNVSFTDYLRSEPAWQSFVEGVAALRKLGMVVWIYDERGYPSGGAGGLVLQKHPEYEAQALAYDPSLTDPFIVRPAYEFTHASNNFHESRRYVNLIDDRATKAFIEVTHDAYRARLGNRLRSGITAFFTDEPSLITVNLGQIQESARKNVPVRDPLDPSVKALPAVPWGYDLAARYRERYGEDLLAVRRSLFTGGTDADRKVRRQYWALIADLVADRFFGALQTWCRQAGVASSGHTLWEESLIHHPTLEGNGLKCLARMDIPGLDMLSSTPEGCLNGNWMAAALPCSAAILTGGRRVMTEVSDFSEQMSGRGQASPDAMRATAAWQAAWGVTEFTLYYSPSGRSADDYRAYGEYVGRLNAILKPAQQDPDILLYYPMHDLWEEYLPVAERVDIAGQSPRAQRIVRSFGRLGQALVRGQMPFSLIDHEFLAGARVRSDGRLVIKGHAFRALVVPDGVDLPPAAARVVERFRKRGGVVARDSAAQAYTRQSLIDALQPAYRLDEATEQVVLGRFLREGKPVLLVANVGQSAYAGHLHAPSGGTWARLDPATGRVETAQADASCRLSLALAPRQAVLLVGPAR